MKYWLMKSEPEVYGISDLEKDGTTWWEGVRNYQARNFMRDDMKVGDPVLFYHSNATPPGIAGLARVSKTAEADKTQFEKKSEYFDPKAKPEAPPWVCPQIEFVEKFEAVIPLEDLRGLNALSDMLLLQKGQRLSVQPVQREHFEMIRKLAVKTETAPFSKSTSKTQATAAPTSKAAPKASSSKTALKATSIASPRGKSR